MFIAAAFRGSGEWRPHSVESAWRLVTGQSLLPGQTGQQSTQQSILPGQTGQQSTQQSILPGQTVSDGRVCAGEARVGRGLCADSVRIVYG